MLILVTNFMSVEEEFYIRRKIVRAIIFYQMLKDES